jgi:hypothetical protein
MKIFKPSGASFEQSTLQAVPVSVDTAALGLGDSGAYALLATGAGSVNFRTAGSISGPDGATNAMFLPPNSMIVIRIEKGQTLSWKHATSTPGTFNVTLGSIQ